MFAQIIVLILFVMGMAVGWMVAEAMGIRQIFGANELYGLLLFILLGASIGYLIGSALSRWLQKALVRAESLVTRVPGWEILLAAFGLIIGLTLATLASFPVRSIEAPELRTVLTFIVFIVFGALGLQLSMAKKDDFGRIFPQLRRPSGSAGRSFGGPKVFDTSVIIDGRVGDLAATGFLEGRFLIPGFVLAELQTIADSDDPLRRNRGRRGLDVLGRLQREVPDAVEIYEVDYPEVSEVDAKLLKLAHDVGGAVLTTDYNLNRVAEIQGVPVLNINELANALKPVVLPGERLTVQVLREGKERGQGVAYLEDGTMVVVEGGKPRIGQEVGVIVTSALQTPAGRMVFAKLDGGDSPG